MKLPSPIDQDQNYQNIIDGTLARQASPLPGVLNLNAPAFATGKYVPIKPYIHPYPIQTPPGMMDHWGWSSSRIYNDLWFEKRIPNLLVHTYSKFVDYVHLWVKKYPQKGIFDDKSLRTNVDKAGQWYEKFGDIGQTTYEKGAVLGYYSIDFESPFPIERFSGGGYKWETNMYIEDILGAGEIPIIGFFAPDRRVIRAKWRVQIDATNPKEIIMSSIDRNARSYNVLEKTKKRPAG